MSIIIEESFKKYFLTCGQTYDNFVFENCGQEFMEEAKSLLRESAEGGLCLVEITPEEEKMVERVLGMCKNEVQRKCLARDYIYACVLSGMGEQVEGKEVVAEQLEAFRNGDYEALAKLHTQSPMMHNIIDTIKECGTKEIVFMLADTQNKTIQKAVNNLMSSRLPCSVKIFTNASRLVTYFDEGGTVIECPHDFMRRNANDFIVTDDEREIE